MGRTAPESFPAGGDTRRYTKTNQRLAAAKRVIPIEHREQRIAAGG